MANMDPITRILNNSVPKPADAVEYAQLQGSPVTNDQVLSNVKQPTQAQASWALRGASNNYGTDVTGAFGNNTALSTNYGAARSMLQQALGGQGTPLQQLTAIQAATRPLTASDIAAGRRNPEFGTALQGLVSNSVNTISRGLNALSGMDMDQLHADLGVQNADINGLNADINRSRFILQMAQEKAAQGDSKAKYLMNVAADLGNIYKDDPERAALVYSYIVHNTSQDSSQDDVNRAASDAVQHFGPPRQKAQAPKFQSIQQGDRNNTYAIDPATGEMSLVGSGPKFQQQLPTQTDAASIAQVQTGLDALNRLEQWMAPNGQISRERLTTFGANALGGGQGRALFQGAATALRHTIYGATLSEGELANFAQGFMPSITDTDTTAASKLMNLRNFLENDLYARSKAKGGQVIGNPQQSAAPNSGGSLSDRWGGYPQP